MTLSANSYGSVVGVAAYVLHATSSTTHTFDATTEPTLTDVERFLNECSAQLNGWLAKAGYVIPVTQADAKFVLDGYANMGAAGKVELTLRNAGYTKDDESRREIKFLDEFARAQKFIESGALAMLGATQQPTPGPFLGLRVGGKTSGGAGLTPLFRRTSFENDPTTESGEDE